MKLPKYSYLVYMTEYGVYAARCVECPNCIGEGKTAKKALKDAMETVEAVRTIDIADDTDSLPEPYPHEWIMDLVGTLKDMAAADDREG